MIKTERNCLLQFFASEIKYSSQFSYAFLYHSKWAADGAYSDIFENGDQFQIQFQPPVHKQTAFSAIRKRMFSKTIPKRGGSENVGLSFFFGGGEGGAPLYPPSQISPCVQIIFTYVVSSYANRLVSTCPKPPFRCAKPLI